MQKRLRVCFIERTGYLCHRSRKPGREQENWSALSKQKAGVLGIIVTRKVDVTDLPIALKLVSDIVRPALARITLMLLGLRVLDKLSKGGIHT